jgi:hypothetical protein
MGGEFVCWKYYEVGGPYVILILFNLRKLEASVIYGMQTSGAALGIEDIACCPKHLVLSRQVLVEIRRKQILSSF